MDTLLEIHPGHFLLLLAPRPFGRKAMNTLAARLAICGPLRVLDAGNWFDGYEIARLVRQRTAQMEQVLQQIQVARAFTCYQVLTLLEQYPVNCDGSAGLPTLVFNLLSTFSDESVALSERERLLDHCLKCLQQLSQHVPVVVSATPTATEVFGQPFAPAPVSPTMLVRLQEAADQELATVPLINLVVGESFVQGKLW